MSEVKRYEYDKITEQLEEHEQGNYVLYADLKKLQAQLEKAEAVISKYANDTYVFYEKDEDTEQLKISKHWRHTSGKSAREYFKEKGE